MILFNAQSAPWLSTPSLTKGDATIAVPQYTMPFSKKNGGGVDPSTAKTSKKPKTWRITATQISAKGWCLTTTAPPSNWYLTMIMLSCRKFRHFGWHAVLWSRVGERGVPSFKTFIGEKERGQTIHIQFRGFVYNLTVSFKWGCCCEETAILGDVWCNTHYSQPKNDKRERRGHQADSNMGGNGDWDGLMFLVQQEQLSSMTSRVRTPRLLVAITCIKSSTQWHVHCQAPSQTKIICRDPEQFYVEQPPLSQDKDTIIFPGPHKAHQLYSMVHGMVLVKGRNTSTLSQSTAHVLNVHVPLSPHS